MAIPYQTAKFKSGNIFAMAIWGPTAKFNSRQYFRLYGIIFEKFRACKETPTIKLQKLTLRNKHDYTMHKRA